MREVLRLRGIHAGAALSLLVLLAPTPVPKPLAEPIREAGRAAESGRPFAALRGLEAALSFEPSFVALHWPAARAALAAGLPEKALFHLDRTPSSDPQVACLRCIGLQEAGLPEAAVECWRGAPAACMSDVASLERMEAAYRSLGDGEGTLLALERLAELAPDDPAVARRLALHWITSDHERARPHLRMAADRGDTLCQALLGLVDGAAAEDRPALFLTRLGKSLIQVNEWELATAAFRRALSLEPDLHEARAYLGLALDNTGGDGETELLAAAAAAPQSLLPQLLLALHFRAAGRPQRALAHLERAEALDPGNPALLAEMAATYEALGDLLSAREFYHSAAELARTNGGFWLLLAEFALSHEIEIEQVAVPAARNAAVLEPDNARAFSALGYAHHLAGQPLLAERCLRRALALNPLDARLQLRWGLQRHAQGDVPAALAALALATDLDPRGVIGTLARRTAEAIASP